MAVNTTGNKNLDAISTGELTLNAMNFSIKYLKKTVVFYLKYSWAQHLMKLSKMLKKL